MPDPDGVNESVAMSLKPDVPRQMGEEGLLVFWRDRLDSGRREGLACILSVCPHPGCTCELVYVNGFLVNDEARAVLWDEEGVHLLLADGSSSDRSTLDDAMFAAVDPDSGETEVDPDHLGETDMALVEWLASEMDGELLEVLHRFRERAKGRPPERPRTDLDLDSLEQSHLVSVDEMVEGARSDDYFVDGRRYWTGIFLCPLPGCDCHTARLVFFEEGAPSSEDVGSVLLDISGPEGFKIEEKTTEFAPGDTPEQLLDELWMRFQRRHDVSRFLRQREAQLKAVGETLWYPVPKPVRAPPKIGRNAPCPCGSGKKYKKCCLVKDSASPTEKSS